MTTSTRDVYSLDGRRIVIGDLLKAGLLQAGDGLTFHRPRLNETYTATVTARGLIALPDGSEYQAPSRAAAEVAGLSAIDGWSAWNVDRLSRSLFELRADLLDGGEENESGVHDRLSTLEADTEVTVRELLSWWDAKGRGRNVVRTVRADLANHDLATFPDFEKVTLDASVALRRRSLNDGENINEAAVVVDLDEDDEDDLGLSLGNLPNAMTEPTSVQPNHELCVAITHMTLDDYSQLPVIDTGGGLRGAVTWKSIAHAALTGTTTLVHQALVDAPDRPFDAELIDVLPELLTSGFIVVMGPDKEVAGIVTMADVVEAYGDLASPFIVVGEIDHLLRRVLRTQLTETELADAVSTATRHVGSFDDLTFGDYQSLLGRKELWSQLGTVLDKKVFVRRLDEVRRMRNSLAHFDPDPLEEGELDKLRRFLDAVRSLAHDAGA